MINSVAIAVTFICAIRSAIVALEQPPNIVKGPEKQYVYHVASGTEQSEVFELQCEATGDPEVKYRWTKDGLPFDESASSRVTRQPRVGTLRFEPTAVEDLGYYQCIAENIWGTSLSNVAVLRRYDMTGFTNISTVEKYVKKGEPVTLECEQPIGYPPPKIFWNLQQNSGALEQISDPRISADENGNLHFSSVTDKDVKTNGAKYACMAASMHKNEYKIGTRYVLLFDDPSATATDVEPKIQYVSPKSITVLKGEQFEVSCIVGGNPMPDVEWQKDDGRLFSKSNGDEPNGFNYKNNGRTLVFAKAEFDHSGVYKCTADNNIGDTITHETKVTVLSAPYWVNEPMKQTKDTEDNVTFACGAHGKPSVKMEWFRNGIPYREWPVETRRMLTKIKDTDEEKIEELTIVDLIKDDTAVYQCNASNEFSYVFKDFFLNVLFLPPQFIEKQDKDIKTKSGMDVTLKCDAYGAPKPTYKWYELPSYNLIISDGQKYVLKNGSLTIFNLTGTDSKRYKCEVKNRAGVQELEIRVVVEEIKNESGVLVAPTGMGIRDGTQPFAKTDWFIGMICAIALVIILAILVCIVKRNRGGNYSVHEKEAALRKDFDREDGGFDEYSKPIYPTSGAPVGSRTSLTSSLKLGDDRDADSMTDYGEDDSSKFGEDGSFIGQYGPNNKRKQSGQSSTGVATFV